MMKLVPVRIGSKYQAELPELLPHRRAANASAAAPPPAPQPPRYKQRWTPARFSDGEVTEFLREFCRLNESELGLHCLMASDFRVQDAVQLLQDARRAKARAQRLELERVSDDAFGSAIATHGKKFFVVQQELAHMSTGDVIRRFYLWKTSPAYRIWRERMKARRGREGSRVRARAESDESDASDFHNEYCELCFTGGQLLCCDGCERAYHFSCVTPPIRDVPTGDWFCARCAATLDASLRAQPSAENAHCRELRLVAGDTAPDSDAETLDLEDVEDVDEEDDDSGVGGVGVGVGGGDGADGGGGVDGGGGGSEGNDGGEARADTNGGAGDAAGDSDKRNDGSERTRPAGAPSASGARAGGSESDVSDAEPARPARASLLPARRLASPSKPALVLEPSGSERERKRKRKTEAPRRIQQTRDAPRE